MSEPGSIVCPNCTARLRVRDRSQTGKNVRCPKCGNSFIPDLPRASIPTQTGAVVSRPSQSEAKAKSRSTPVEKSPNVVRLPAAAVKNPRTRLPLLVGSVILGGCLIAIVAFFLNGVDRPVPGGDDGPAEKPVAAAQPVTTEIRPAATRVGGDGPAEEPVPAAQPATAEIRPAPTPVDKIDTTASVRWSNFGMMETETRMMPQPMEVVVDLHGEAAQRSMVCGMYELTKAELNDGRPLESLNARPFLGGDPFIQFVNVDRGSVTVVHPSDGLRAAFLFRQPNPLAASVGRFEGSVKLRVPKGKKTIVIPNLLAQDGKFLQHAELDATGLRLSVERRGVPLFLKLTEGDLAAVGDLIPITPDGKRLKERFLRGSARPGASLFLLAVDAKIPSDIGLEITILTGLSDLTIPFRFADLPIPPLPKVQR